MDYLQRLLDTALTPPPVLAAPELTPVVRSDSPVFEQDQLLGLEAFAPETAFHRQPPLAPAVEAPAQTRPPRPASEAPRPAPAAVPDYPTALETGQIDFSPPPRPVEPQPPAKPGDAPESAAQAPAPPEPFAENEPTASHQDPTVEQAAPTLRGEAPDAETPRTRSIASGYAQHEMDSPPPEPPGTAVGDLAPRMTIRTLATLVPPTDGASSEPEDFAALPVEITPRPRPAFEPRDETPETRPEPAAAPAPLAKTPRLTVEAAPERPEAPARKPRPATAAAASIIGPLGDMRAARRLFALGR